MRYIKLYEEMTNSSKILLSINDVAKEVFSIMNDYTITGEVEVSVTSNRVFDDRWIYSVEVVGNFGREDMGKEFSEAIKEFKYVFKERENVDLVIFGNVLHYAYKGVMRVSFIDKNDENVLGPIVYKYNTEQYNKILISGMGWQQNEKNDNTKIFEDMITGGNFLDVMQLSFSIMEDYVETGKVAIRGEKIYVSRDYNKFEPFNHVEFNIPLYKVEIFGKFDGDVTDEFKEASKDFIYEYYLKSGEKLYNLSSSKHHYFDNQYVAYFIPYEYKNYWKYYGEFYDMVDNLVYSDLINFDLSADGEDVSSSGINNFDIYDNDGKRFTIAFNIFSNINLDGSFEVRTSSNNSFIVNVHDDIDQIKNRLIMDIKSYFKTELRENVDKFTSALDDSLVDYTISSTTDKKDYILLKLEVSSDFEDKFYDIKITNDKIYIGDKELSYDDLKNDLWDFFY